MKRLKKLGKHGIYVPLTKGILGIIVIQAVSLSLIAILMFTGLTNSYTEFMTAETSDILSLYTERVENNLNQIEKASYEILSDQTFQNNLTVYTGNPSTGDGYAALNALYNQLFADILEESFVDSGYFVFNNNYQMSFKVRTGTALDKKFLETVRAAAVQAKGSSVWMSDPANPSVLVSARQINAITTNDKFAQRGVLILVLNTPKLLNYSSPSQQKYESNLFCSVNGNMLSSPNSRIAPKNIQQFFSKKSGSGTVNLNGVNYFYVIKNSSDGAIKGWQFVNILRFDNVLSGIDQSRMVYLFSFMALVLAVLFLLSSLTSRICRPLAQVTESMGHVKDEKFEKIPQEISGLLKIKEGMELIRSYNRMIQKIDYLINEVYRKQLTISDMRYKMLQQQINPHFLYNTLETIHWKAVEFGDQDSSTMALTLSELLRATIKKPDVITVEEDMKLVSDYVAIQKIRFEERLEVYLEEPGRFAKYKIPKMTLQPIVENCIRHNLEKYAEVCVIRISFEGRENDFSITVRDNGKHFNQEHVARVMLGEESTAGHGLGLKNIQERLQICFGEEYGLQITDESGGACVEIRLPYCDSDEISLGAPVRGQTETHNQMP